MRRLLALLCGAILAGSSVPRWGWVQAEIDVPDPLALARAFVPDHDLELPDLGGPQTVTLEIGPWRDSTVDVAGLDVPLEVFVGSGLLSALLLAIGRRRVNRRLRWPALVLAAAPLYPVTSLMMALVRQESAGFHWSLAASSGALVALSILAVLPASRSTRSAEARP